MDERRKESYIDPNTANRIFDALNQLQVGVAETNVEIKNIIAHLARINGALGDHAVRIESNSKQLTQMKTIGSVIVFIWSALLAFKDKIFGN